MTGPSRRRYAAALAVPAVAAVLLAGCGSGDTGSAARSQAPGASTSEPVTTSEPAASASADGAANGLADKSAAEILVAARQGLAAADSFRVEGKGSDNKNQFTIDMGFVSGKGARGTVSISGQEFEMLVTGGQTYVKATSAFLTSQGAPKEAAKLFEGKWLLFPKTQNDVFGPFTDSDKFAKSVLEPSGTISKSGTKEIDGVPAVGLVDGSKDSKDAGTLWIATEGEPRPLRIEPAAQGGSQGTLDFSYDVDVDLTAPPKDKVIDIGALKGGGVGGSLG